MSKIGDYMKDEYKMNNDPDKSEKNVQKPFEKSLDDLLDYIEKEFFNEANHKGIEP